MAVLTNKRTASSGEAVAIAFRKRANARSFGVPTSGLSTGNSSWTLSDGAKLLLTTSRMTDRTGHVYGGVIDPDELINEEEALDAGVAWLREHAACQG